MQNKWLIIAILLTLFPPRAYGQWVKFEACGQTPGDEIFGPRHFSPTDTISHYWIWAPAILAVQAYKGPVMSKVQCTSIMISARKILVVGTSEDVMRQIKDALKTHGD